jgi:hypothetical protein
MKKTDIALILFIALISVAVAYFVAKAVLGDPGEQVVTVPTARSISADVIDPSKEIFNSGTINPTVEVCISGGCEGDAENSNPPADQADDKDNSGQASGGTSPVRP